ncbi:zinc finger protein 287-like [Anopheles nili]|uniref:zinc finger protein 287-like n=1 Tax=Anopheles nili TaxID=185578 RepID=UPI00237A63AA|nr:zinc finger protein 287-like [Anopheles nili]
MPPEASPTIELTNQTCRLCLGNVDKLMPLECSLTANELINVIYEFLKIDLDENWPFQNACHKCIMKIRLIESIRSSFDQKNRIFDVLWTQYKRIYLRNSSVAAADSVNVVEDEAGNVNSDFIISGVLVEKTEVEIVPPDVLLKSEVDHSVTLVKQEDFEAEEPVMEELVYEEMTLDENELDEQELIVEDKEMLEDELEEEMIEEHIVEQDDEQLPDGTEDEMELPIDESNEAADTEETFQDDEGYFDKTLNRCYICMETMETLEQLQSHLEMLHKNLLPFHCDKCLAYFDAIEAVNQHLISHQYPFVCLYCPQKYCSEALLLNHNKTCRAHRCPFCMAEFEMMTELTAHKKLHMAQIRAMNQCKTCKRTFTQACNLQRHLRSHPCGSSEMSPRRKRGRRSAEDRKNQHSGSEHSWDDRMKSLLVCQVCSKKFESNSNLARHMDREHAEFNFPLYTCDICPKKFTAYEKCVRHRSFHRSSKAKSKPDKKEKSENVCTICNKEFRVDYLYLRHLAEVHSLSLELFQCDQCGRKFSTELKLRKHQYNSHRENKTLYVCSHCGQKFEKKLTLKDHETKHLGAPAYKCEICDKRFIHKHSLDRHALVHSDVKEFACEFCQKTFKRNTTLVIHRRIHTGEKPYLCTPCDLRFIDSSTLIKHRQRVHAKAAE